MEVLRVIPGCLIYHAGERYAGGAIAPELTEEQKAYHAESLEVIEVDNTEIKLTEELVKELEESGQIPDPVEPVIDEEPIEIPDPVEFVDTDEPIEDFEIE